MLFLDAHISEFQIRARVYFFSSAFCVLQKTSLDKAKLYHQIQVERMCMKAWRKYMQIMKSAVSESGTKMLAN